MTSALREMIEAFESATPAIQAEMVELASTVGVWAPSPGPQTLAYNTEADETLYGGQAGGGKTDLLIGMSLTKHSRSLILRRFNDDARDIAHRTVDVVGNDSGLNRSTLEWRMEDGRYIEFGGCKAEDDKQRYKGRAHDLKAFDELSDFTESQYLFITNWNRSVDPDQKCRIIGATNPPTTAEGLWIVRRWAAWLDPRHPNPAKSGELRWYVRDQDDNDIEVDGPGEYEVDGIMLKAKSRTFIRSTLNDNPYLKDTDYGATLDQLPAVLRRAYRDGHFDVSLKDADFQAIPTAWVMAAQQRWKPTPPDGVPMCSMGVDCTGGGDDPLVIAMRYDGWYAPMEVVPGREVPMESIGRTTSAHIIQHRRDGAAIVLDMGGGYGGPAYEHLKDNFATDTYENPGEHTIIKAHKGSEASKARTHDRQYGFTNKRSEVIWRFREALDPNQEGGSVIALPPDQEILADLTAPTFEIRNGKIKIEDKVKIKDRLGRSPDKGDAVVMAWSYGTTSYQVKGGDWSRHSRSRSVKPSVNVSHPSRRKRR